MSRNRETLFSGLGKTVYGRKGEKSLHTLSLLSPPMLSTEYGVFNGFIFAGLGNWKLRALKEKGSEIKNNNHTRFWT